MLREIAVLLAMIGGGVPSAMGERVIRDPIAECLATEEFATSVADEKTDRIYRAELDLNGDGKKIVFLTSFAARGNYDWTAYLPVASGFVVGFRSTLTKSLNFSPDNSYVGYIEEIKHSGVLTELGRSSEGYEVVAFWVTGHKAHIKTVATVSAENVEKSRILKKYFSSQREAGRLPFFRIEAISLNDLRARGYAIPK